MNYLLSDGLPSSVIEASQSLLNRSCVWVNFESMLGEFPGYSWHVRTFPSEDVPVLMEKFDDHAFLFVIQSVSDGQLLRRICRVNGYLLDV